MNNRFMLLTSQLLITLSLACSTAVFAEQDKPASKPDADKVNPLDNVDINIIKREDRTLETHSINGVIYKVKVIPSSGPVYYLYDTDGDGSLETRSNKEISETTVQQWKIFEW